MKEQQSLYLEFLQYSLEPRKSPPNMEKMDWGGLFEFAVRQSLLGVLFGGLERLPQEAPYRPPKELVFKWVSMVEQIKRTNIQVNKDACQLTEVFAQDGVKSCVLKGQANARLYPEPLYRMPGDIDIWTDMGSAADVVAYVRSRAPEASVEYHHIDWPHFSRTPVEVHYFPSFMGNLFHEWRLRRYFERHKANQFNNAVELPGTGGKAIFVLGAEVDCVFQLSHIMHHFFFEGIGLRQMVDYYYLLKVGMEDVRKDELVGTLRYLHLLKFARGIMWLMSQVLGLDENHLYVQPDGRIGKMILSEILQSGNFGHYDSRYNFKGLSVYRQYLLEVRRNLRFARSFPSEVLWGRPVSRFWHAFYKQYLRSTLRRGGKFTPHSA